MKIIKNNIEFKGEKYRAVIEIDSSCTKVDLYKNSKHVSSCIYHGYGFIQSYVSKIDFVELVKNEVLDYVKSKEEWEEEKAEMCRDLQEWDGKIDV